MNRSITSGRFLAIPEGKVGDPQFDTDLDARVGVVLFHYIPASELPRVRQQFGHLVEGLPELGVNQGALLVSVCRTGMRGTESIAKTRVPASERYADEGTLPRWHTNYELTAERGEVTVRLENDGQRWTIRFLLGSDFDKRGPLLIRTEGCWGSDLQSDPCW